MIIVIDPKIKRKVKDNRGYCPCAIVKNDDTRCMCKEFREKDTNGLCHCGLYYKLVNKIENKKLRHSESGGVYGWQVIADDELVATDLTHIEAKTIYEALKGEQV